MQPTYVLGINKLLLEPKLIGWLAFHTTFKTFLKCWWNKELLITSCTTYPMSCFTLKDISAHSKTPRCIIKKTKMKNLLSVELWPIEKKLIRKCWFNIAYAEYLVINLSLYLTLYMKLNCCPRIRAIFTPYKHLEVNIKLPICHEKKTHYSWILHMHHVQKCSKYNKYMCIYDFTNSFTY